MMQQQHDDLQEFRKRMSDYLSYKKLAVRVLGAVQLIAGLLSMALGVGAICTVASGYHIGYGIWAGFTFSVTGILAICSTHFRNTCLITTTLVMCILSACLGAVQFCLGVVAAHNDRWRSTTGELSPDDRYLGYDIYYARNSPFHYRLVSDQYFKYWCDETYGAFTWSLSWGPVDVLLLLVGFLEAAVAIATAGLGCAAVCCGNRRIRQQVVGMTYAQSQVGSVVGTESRISHPTVYKVVPSATMSHSVY